MTSPLVISIPHRLGRDEAVRRLKSGLGNARTNFGQLLSVEEETWSGNRVTFRVRSLGQSASGIIDVNESDLRLEVTLPWLLAKLTERFVPALRREGTLLLGKK